MHSDISTKVKNNISLNIFLNFLSWSEELYAVQCEATGRHDHGRTEPRCMVFDSAYRIDSPFEKNSNLLFPALVTTYCCVIQYAVMLCYAVLLYSTRDSLSFDSLCLFGAHM